MKIRAALPLTLAVLAGCDELTFAEHPDPPSGVTASYFARTVTVEWELPAHWRGESFLVYSAAAQDPDWLLIAEVSSCIEGYCAYSDINIEPNTAYDYYVSAFDAETGTEAPSEPVSVEVPDFGAPPAPTWIEVVALDRANYIRWDQYSLTADDWWIYRVYVETDQGYVIIGETDSEGFLDERVENGVTYRYAVSAVDFYGHEGALSYGAEGTARPDFTGEVLFNYHSRRAESGFRFQPTEARNPVVDGDSEDRHFRLEADDRLGWLLVPGPEAAIFPTPFRTTALRCGPGSDGGCIDVSAAPSSGYVGEAMELEAQVSYIFRVTGDDDELHYGVIRTEMLGYSRTDEALMVFSWAYQTQPNNVGLSLPG